MQKSTAQFTFQGGEPTLAGLEYLNFLRKPSGNATKKNISVSYNIQTNGYHLQETWFPFFEGK